MNSVMKPIRRSPLRRALGKEYFCLKERLSWRLQRIRFARKRQVSRLSNEVVSHESTLLRPLKDVDMTLQVNKITNLRIAVEQIHGLIIRPGETFSVWKLVGRPTRSKGYLPGLTLSNGQLAEGIGGGLCQLGNLLYWMAIHSQLTITKRWRHSYDVFPDVNRTLPFGSGATLSYNYIDLRIYNGTEADYQLNLWLSEKKLHGAICCSQQPEFSYEVFERDHRFEQQWWGGYTRHNEIWRKAVHRTTGETSEELVTANHAIMMYNPMISYQPKA